MAPKSPRLFLASALATVMSSAVEAKDAPDTPVVDNIILRPVADAKDQINGALVGITFKKSIPVLASVPVVQNEVDGKMVVQHVGILPKRHGRRVGFGQGSRFAEVHPDLGYVPACSLYVHERNNPTGTYLMSQVPTGYRVKRTAEDEVRTLDDGIAQICKQLDAENIFRKAETPDQPAPWEKTGEVHVLDGVTYLNIPVNDIILYAFLSIGNDGSLVTDNIGTDIWSYVPTRTFVDLIDSTPERPDTINFRGGPTGPRAEKVLKAIWDQAMKIEKEKDGVTKPMSEWIKEFKGKPLAERRGQPKQGLKTQAPNKFNPANVTGKLVASEATKNEVKDIDI